MADCIMETSERSHHTTAHVHKEARVRAERAESWEGVIDEDGVGKVRKNVGKIGKYNVHFSKWAASWRKLYFIYKFTEKKVNI